MREPAPRPAPAGRLRFAVPALIALVALLSACGAPTRYPTSQLRPGICFDDATLLDSADSGVVGVPCDAPHDNEVVAVLPPREGGPPPQERCSAVKVDSPQPVEMFAVMGVSDDSGGTDAVACIAFRADFEPLRGSLVSEASSS